MTRVNLVDPKYLADQHLFAEYRELKHVPKALVRSLKTRKWADIEKEIPKEFTLGKGHVKFFWNKLQFINNRFIACKVELERRNYDISTIPYDIMLPLQSLPDGPQIKNWVPSVSEIQTSWERIQSKILMKPEWYKYYGGSYQLGILAVDN